MQTESIILVDLDTLLDSRLAVYRKMGCDTQSIVKQGYKTRIYDRFEGVDAESFITLYKARDREILAGSMLTDLYRVLMRRMELYVASQGSMSAASHVELQINVYPYSLSDEEQELIRDHIYPLLEEKFPVINMVSRSPEELSFEMLASSSITDYYTYGYELWLNHRADEMNNKGTLKETLIHTPLLITAEKDNFQKWYTDNPDIVETLLTELSCVINIIFEPSSWYSFTGLEAVYPDWITAPTMEIEDLPF